MSVNLRQSVQQQTVDTTEGCNERKSKGSVSIVVLWIDNI